MVGRLEPEQGFFIMTEIEVWKKIALSEYYEVSNFGGFRSINKTIINHNGTKRVFIGKSRAFCKDKYGYNKVSFRYKTNNGKKLKNALVHRLVAEAFVPNPSRLKTVNHKNGIKTDNKVENLEWLSAEDNLRHAISIGIKIGPKSEGAFGVKLNREKILEIRELYKTNTPKEISEIYGISEMHVYAIKNKRVWKNI